MTIAPFSAKGPFLPSSQVFPEDESQRIIVHTDTFINIASAVNQREIASYETYELPTGIAYFNSTSPSRPRPGFRKVFSIGAIAAGATSTTPHGITTISEVTHVYGAAITGTPDFRPLPYSSATAVTGQIELKVDGTNIVIINGAAAPAITSATVVVEYLKS